MTSIFEIRQLTADFYKENNLVEMLDKGADKGRGYGVLLVKVEGYKFAIPFRSRMLKHHKANYTTRIYKDGDKEVRHGLDYTKAVIIKEDRYVSNRTFFLEQQSDFIKISQKEHFIKSQFEKYVKKYIRALEKEDKNILNSLDYRYSTLQNYHNELCPQYIK